MRSWSPPVVRVTTSTRRRAGHREVVVRAVEGVVGGQAGARDFGRDRRGGDERHEGEFGGDAGVGDVGLLKVACSIPVRPARSSGPGGRPGG